MDKEQETRPFFSVKKNQVALIYCSVSVCVVVLFFGIWLLIGNYPSFFLQAHPEREHLYIGGVEIHHTFAIVRVLIGACIFSALAVLFKTHAQSDSTTKGQIATGIAAALATVLVYFFFSGGDMRFNVKFYQKNGEKIVYEWHWDSPRYPKDSQQEMTYLNSKHLYCPATEGYQCIVRDTKPVGIGPVTRKEDRFDLFSAFPDTVKASLFCQKMTDKALAELSEEDYRAAQELPVPDEIRKACRNNRPLADSIEDLKMYYRLM